MNFEIDHTPGNRPSLLRIKLAGRCHAARPPPSLAGVRSQASFG